jgi:uncharacterized damage-inducible protein DinB
MADMDVAPPSPSRVDPPYQNDERAMLDGWLEFHRTTLAMKCAGLPAEELRRRAVPPSTLSLLGLVRHMTEVERSWFRRCLAGEDLGPLYCTDTNPDADFDDVDTADIGEAFATWQEVCDDSRRLAAEANDLDTVGRKLREGEAVSLRWILIHMIEEYARHNGHADLLRQTIDGATGD